MRTLPHPAAACSAPINPHDTDHNPPKSPYIVPAHDEDNDDYEPLSGDSSTQDEHSSEPFTDALLQDVDLFDLDFIDDREIGRISGSGFCCIFDDFDLMLEEATEACSYNDQKHTAARE